jgi:lysophospholipase L1-like esterase
MNDHRRLRIAAGILVTLGLVILQASAAKAQDAGKANTAVKPAPRDDKWKERHDKFVAMAKKGHIDVLFLGDSITDGWGGENHNAKAAGSSIFAKEFVPLHTANFGIGGDRTQHVLWRLQNGELDGIHPKVVMLMIGTNNSNRMDNTSEEIADGITAIVKEIHKRSPHTKTLLLAVFPRGEKPNPQREKIKKVNDIIARLDDGGKTVKYLNIGEKFLQPDGTIARTVMPDFLHLSPLGYQMWADAVKGPIDELLRKN